MSALLSEELLRWPDVSARPMFGMRAFYHGAVIFAMLPDQRALESPTAIACKRPVGTHRREGPKWRLFELKGEGDLGEAIACRDKAYRTAGRAQNRL